MRPCTRLIVPAEEVIKATSLNDVLVEHAPWCRTAPNAPLIPIKPLDADTADQDVLDVDVLVDAEGAALAPVAGLLHAAERRAGGTDDPGVRAHDPVLELLRHPQEACVVTSVEVRREAVDRVVGDPDRLLLG